MNRRLLGIAAAFSVSLVACVPACMALNWSPLYRDMEGDVALPPQEYGKDFEREDIEETPAAKPAAQADAPPDPARTRAEFEAATQPQPKEAETAESTGTQTAEAESASSNENGTASSALKEPPLDLPFEGWGSAPAQDLNETARTNSAAESSDAEPAKAMDEESADASAEEEEEQSASADAEGKPLAKKKPKLVGKQPTEQTLDPAYFFNKSVQYMKENRLQDALNYVGKALELNPNYWEAWYQRALVYQLAGYDAAAARRYIALIERKPDMIQPHIAMGMLYRKHGNYSHAEKEYRAALDINWKSFVAHYNLANLLMEQKKYEDALKEYRICQKLQPDNAQVHNNMGVIYQHKNYLEEAADQYLRASHLDPANPQYVKNLTAVKALLSKKAPKALSM